METDDELIRRARAYDHEAYADLVRRYSGVAHRTAVMVGGATDADDAVQDAFLRAYSALDRFQPGAAFRPWLLTIVANCAHNRRRSAARQLRLGRRKGELDPPALSAASAESDAVTHEARRRLLDAVFALPDKQRLVVTCRFLLELSEAETATVLDIPVGTVKSRLARALDRLRHVVGGDAS